MTREDKLYSMTMANLQIVADKLGVKINPKAAKSKAVEKILEAEADKEWEEEATKEKETQEKKQAESDKAAEDAMNKKLKELKDDQLSEEETKKFTDKHPGSKKAEKSKGKKTNLKLSELTYKGKTKSIKEWAVEINMPWPTLYDRVNRNGWTIEEAIETPLGQRRSK